MAADKLHRSRKILLQLLVVLVFAGLVFIGIMSVRDNIRHNKLNSSIDNLANSLRQHGITGVTKSSGCGRPYSEFGPSAKSCSIALTTDIASQDEKSAYRLLSEYIDSVASTGRFELKGNLPASIIDDDNLPFGYIGYKDKSTRSICTLDYDYEKLRLTVGFTCNDTSWFISTFEG